MSCYNRLVVEIMQYQLPTSRPDVLKHYLSLNVQPNSQQLYLIPQNPLNLTQVSPTTCQTNTKYIQLNIAPKEVIPPVSLKRISRYTLPIFLERAKIVHGNKYDYSQITPGHIINKRSKVPIKCNTCHHEWTPTVGTHIDGKNCPSCTGHLRWTYERFIVEARAVHDDKYDYSQITPEHITNVQSCVPIKCKTCDHEWSPTVGGHIRKGNNCPSCTGHIPWTYDRFIKRAHEIHGDKYDYSLITKEHITGVMAYIPLRCKQCTKEWSPTINAHVNNKHGCPRCITNAPWTLKSIKERGEHIHGNKFNYDKVTEDHVKGVGSQIPVTCNDCTYEWWPNIGNHFNHGYGCPSCSNKAPWTLGRFLQAANYLHGNKYNYIMITEQHIQNIYSRVPLICIKCNHQWAPTIHDHINGERGCPHCCKFRAYSNAQINWVEGIMQTENIIIQHALSPQGEVRIPNIGKVDGFCHETNTVYEFHGDFWHGNPIKYQPHNVNPVSNKTYGELYQKTIERDQNIRNLGYNLIVKWETDLPQ